MDRIFLSLFELYNRAFKIGVQKFNLQCHPDRKDNLVLRAHFPVKNYILHLYIYKFQLSEVHSLQKYKTKPTMACFFEHIVSQATEGNRILWILRLRVS